MMTLQDVLQIVGGIGVIVSITYAGLQVRRNTRALRAATYQQTAGSFIAAWDDLSRNPDLVSLLLRGGDDFSSLDRVEKARFRFFTTSYCRRFEIAYFQHQIGILTDADWQAMSADIDSIFSLPGVRAAWALVKNRSNPAFRVHLDERIARIEAATPDTSTARGSTATAQVSQAPKP